MVDLIFELRSARRFFTTFAETRSLNGMITRMGGVVVSVDGMCCWSATLESTNCLTARLNKCFGYLSFKNTFNFTYYSSGVDISTSLVIGTFETHCFICSQSLSAYYPVDNNICRGYYRYQYFSDKTCPANASELLLT